MLLLSRAENIWSGRVARANMICGKSASMSLPRRISGMDSRVARANMICGRCVAMSLLSEAPRWAESWHGKHQEWACHGWLCHCYAVKDTEADLSWIHAICTRMWLCRFGLIQVHLISSFIQDRALVTASPSSPTPNIHHA